MDTLKATLSLRRWQGERGTYHLVLFDGDQAQELAMRARLHRLEFGTQRGFGSVRVMARIGDTEWKTSVFPQRGQSEWVLLVSRKVMRAEGIAEGDRVEATLSF